MCVVPSVFNLRSCLRWYNGRREGKTKRLPRLTRVSLLLAFVPRAGGPKPRGAYLTPEL
jgi:hypothetical protein